MEKADHSFFSILICVQKIPQYKQSLNMFLHSMFPIQGNFFKMLFLVSSYLVAFRLGGVSQMYLISSYPCCCSNLIIAENLQAT